MKTTSLVTGGAGFIGSHVAEHLLKMGHTVIVLDDLSGGYERNISPKVIFIHGSITDTKSLESLFTIFQFDYVYHLAAYAAEGLSHFIRHFNYQNNVIGSVNLINQAIKHKIKHFVFTSSIAVYGTNRTPMIETLTPKPEDPYGVAKYAVEMDLKLAQQMFGLNYTIFRPHNVYGERQNHGDPYRNVLGIFMNNIMQRKPLTIFGDGKQSRAFSYIDDVAPYIAQSVEVEKARNEIINIGADQPYTVMELAKTVAKAMRVKPEIVFLPARHEVVHAYSDHSKARKIFGTKKTITLDTGIKRMVTWAKKIGPLEPHTFKNVELTINLPPSWQKLIEK